MTAPPGDDAGRDAEARTVAADLALAADPSVVERSADPGEFVIRACQRARAWLREALDHGDIGQVAELRSRAEAVRVYSAQQQLGRDAQLAVAEIVRRAEQGLAEAVRKGQATGQLLGPVHPGPGRGKPGNGGTRFPGRRSPADYLGTGRTRTEMYAMADGVTDEEFERALAEAKAEGNLSRANVLRNLRQRRTPAAAPGQARRPDSNQVAWETASALEAIATGISLLDPAELDMTEVPVWAASITVSLRAVNRLVRTLRQMTATNGDPIP
jgi:hypothetical protein